MTENAINPFKPRLLRITEPGWENYTGHIGTVAFEAGVSTHPVDWREQGRIGALVRMESAESKEESAEINPAAELLRGRTLDGNDARVKGSGSLIMVGGVERIATSVYSRQELELIADKKGLNGLRDIASGWGVHGRAIKELIDRILDAQLKSDPSRAEAAPETIAESPAEEAPASTPDPEG